MNAVRRGFVALAWLLTACCWAGDVQTLVAYNSYLHPPFKQADGTGLAQDLVIALNRQLQGRLRLQLEHVPRERLLRRHLDGGETFTAVVLFLSPAFVDDADQRKWLWTTPMFEDRNVLVFSAAKAPGSLKRLDELKGLRFGAVRGNRYAGLDEMVARGQLRRDVGPDELTLLQQVVRDRIDFAQMNRLMFSSLASRPELRNRLAALPQPEHAPFARRILVGRQNPAVHAQMEQAVAALRCDKTWSARLREVGAELAPCAAKM